MDAKQLARLRWLLRSDLPLVGGWLQRRAMRRLAQDGSPGAARVLAECAANTPVEALRESILSVLRALTAQPAIDAVCGVWAETRGPMLAGLLREKNWQAAAPPRLSVLTALLTGWEETIKAGGAEAVEPLVQACDDGDPELARRAEDCLPRLRNPDAVDALCARWGQSREARLGHAIRQAGHVAREPMETRVLSALQAEKTELLAGESAEIVEPLLQACADNDSQLASRARAALERLERPEARDALCRVVLERDHPVARETTQRLGWSPKDARQRALFFFLTEQWGKYESLDFDQALLRATYETGEGRLRARMAEKARRAGRVDWVNLIVPARQERSLQSLSDADWETTSAVLAESNRWSELWRLALLAPPLWGLRLLRQLGTTGWKPEAGEQRHAFESLLVLVGKCCQDQRNDRAQAPVLPPAGLGVSLPALGRLTVCQRVLEGHAGPVSCLALSPDSTLAATGSNDGTVRLWRLTDGAALAVLKGHDDWIAAVTFSRDGRWLASASRDGTAGLWSVAEGQAVARLRGHQGDVRCLLFTTDGNALVTGSDDRTVRLWRIPDGQPSGVLEGHVDAVSCLALQADNRLVASGSYDGNARLWRLPDGESVAILRGHKAVINCLAFSPDGQFLVTGSKDRSLLLWRLPAGEQLVRLKGHKEDVTCLAVSPDGSLVASGSWDNTIRLWRLPDGALVDILGSTGTMDGHTGWITALAFSPDGRLLTSASVDCTVCLWSTPDGRLLKTLSGHQDRVSCVGVSPDGRQVLSASWDRTARCWESELARLATLPLADATFQDLDWAQEMLGDPLLAPQERAWLEFLAAAWRWLKRHDVQVEERGPISVGEFDIEISD
jgi:WD40 repeat protein